MQNILKYCDNICQLVEFYGEEYINHLRWELVNADEFIRKVENSQIQKERPFEGNIQLANQIGKKCDRWRNECITEVTEKMWQLPTNKQKSYVKRMLEQMSYIQLNHPIGKTEIFETRVIPDVFRPIIDFFKSEGIDVPRILSECRKDKGDGFCSWLRIEEKPLSSFIYKTQDITDSFERLFTEKHRSHIADLITRLEENSITMNGKFIYSKKNYLAKLLVYLKEEGIVFIEKPTPAIKCFYRYFGITVSEKAGENTVTIRNLTDIYKNGIAGLSEEEKKEFALISSVFISVRK